MNRSGVLVVSVRGISRILVACRTGVNFCVFRGESEASASCSSPPRARLLFRARLAFASVRLKYAKITPVLQARIMYFF